MACPALGLVEQTPLIASVGHRRELQKYLNTHQADFRQPGDANQYVSVNPGLPPPSRQRSQAT
jgi:hypothetical protein